MCLARRGVRVESLQLLVAVVGSVVFFDRLSAIFRRRLLAWGSAKHPKGSYTSFLSCEIAMKRHSSRTRLY